MIPQLPDTDRSLCEWRDWFFLASDRPSEALWLQMVRGDVLLKRPTIRTAIGGYGDPSVIYEVSEPLNDAGEDGPDGQRLAAPLNNLLHDATDTVGAQHDHVV